MIPCEHTKLRKFVAGTAAIIALLFCLNLSGAPAHKKMPPVHPIDLNSASIEQFEELPGIGPVTAKKIIEFREKSGPFRKVEDLLAIPRITKAKLEKLRPYVRVGAPNPTKKKQSPATPSQPPATALGAKPSRLLISEEPVRRFRGRSLQVLRLCVGGW